ncbi:MAG: hypothetical protein ABI042_19010 [Verrucomicrobiota bacterium]
MIWIDGRVFFPIRLFLPMDRRRCPTVFHHFALRHESTIEGGDVYLNNTRKANFQRAVTTNDLLFGKHILLRKGKKNYVVVTVK